MRNSTKPLIDMPAHVVTFPNGYQCTFEHFGDRYMAEHLAENGVSMSDITTAIAAINDCRYGFLPSYAEYRL